MSKLMDIKKLEEGMVLAEPVINKHGQVLLPAGAVLKNNHKRILATWNIKFVNIKEDDNEDEFSNISPELYKRAKAILDENMLWKPRNINEFDLYNACVINIARNIR